MWTLTRDRCAPETDFSRKTQHSIWICREITRPPSCLFENNVTLSLSLSLLVNLWSSRFTRIRVYGLPLLVAFSYFKISPWLMPSECFLSLHCVLHNQSWPRGYHFQATTRCVVLLSYTFFPFFSYFDFHLSLWTPRPWSGVFTYLVPEPINSRCAFLLLCPLYWSISFFSAEWNQDLKNTYFHFFHM